ncbi:MAG: hypothetical protein ACRYHQ_25280 [Janthinobacterium lividum]
MAALFAVLTGAVLLVWPALLNGYPVLFSDTGGLLDMGLAGDMGWDKPWVYGPFLAVTSLGLSLWGSVAMQGLLLSHLLWLSQAVVAPPRPGRHLALCAVLAVGTAAPWFASLLMPDIFAPLVVLCLFVLTFGPGRVGRGALAWAGVVGTVAIASHLSHLIVAAAVIAMAGLLRWRLPWRPALPLAAALLFLLGSNLVGNGVLAISPYGSVFMLARLIGDGPGRTYVDVACPAAGWRICAWSGRLPSDSDEFLWHPNGPVWADGFGPIRYAPEAAKLVPAIIAAYPGGVLLAAAANAVRQVGLVRVGDALVALHLDVALLPRLELYFPVREAVAYRASLQAVDQLGGIAAPFAPLHILMLLAGMAGSLWTVGCGSLSLRKRFGVRRSWLRSGEPGTATAHGPASDGTALARPVTPALSRREREKPEAYLRGLALLALTGLLANAAATGALSGPHDRYQARIAWLVVLPPLLAYAARRDASCRATSDGDILTSAS